MPSNESYSAVKMSEDDDTDKRNDRRLLFSVDENPPILMTVLLAFQQFAVNFGGCVSASVVISGLVCAGDQPLVQAKLLNTFFVISGICTFLQSTFGVRIPTIQSSAGSFLVVVAALMATRDDKCMVSTSDDVQNVTTNNTMYNPDLWRIRLREIQGAIILAGITQALVGLLGIVGMMMRFIGPITISATIMSIGLQLALFALQLCEKHWGISLLTAGLIVIFSMYLRHWSPKLLVYNRQKGCRLYPYPFQKVLSVLLGVIIAWVFCLILTVSGVFSSNSEHYDYAARTDRISNVISESQWIYIPFPGQWGTPTFSIPSYLAMLVPTVSSILESIGDYHACARACELPPPPIHAVNRGVFIEGIGSVIAGVYGGGGSITSYSQNSGIINITKAGSRVIFQVSALMFVLVGIFGKVGAAITALPVPIIGGTFLTSVAMIFGVSIGNLAHVNIQSPRNQMILGLSVIMGIIIPVWVTDNAGIMATGNRVFDDTLNALLKTSMFIAGTLACFLDNTIPGSLSERGMKTWRMEDSESKSDDLKVYGFPYIMSWLKRHRIFTHIPISPVYKVRTCCKSRKEKLVN